MRARTGTSGVSGNVKSAGGLPSRIERLCSETARWRATPTASARAVANSLSCPRYIEVTYLSGTEPALDEPEGALAQCHRLTIEVTLRIQLAKLKVVLGYISLQGQLHRPEQRFASRFIGTRRAHVVTDAPEKIGLRKKP